MRTRLIRTSSRSSSRAFSGTCENLRSVTPDDHLCHFCPYSIATTSTTPPAVLKTDIRRALDRIQVQYRETKIGFDCIHLLSIDISWLQDPHGTPHPRSNPTTSRPRCIMTTRPADARIRPRGQKRCPRYRAILLRRRPSRNRCHCLQLGRSLTLRCLRVWAGIRSRSGLRSTSSRCKLKLFLSSILLSLVLIMIYRSHGCCYMGSNSAVRAETDGNTRCSHVEF